MSKEFEGKIYNDPEFLTFLGIKEKYTENTENIININVDDKDLLGKLYDITNTAV